MKKENVTLSKKDSLKLRQCRYNTQMYGIKYCITCRNSTLTRKNRKLFLTCPNMQTYDVFGIFGHTCHMPEKNLQDYHEPEHIIRQRHVPLSSCAVKLMKVNRIERKLCGKKPAFL